MKENLDLFAWDMTEAETLALNAHIVPIPANPVDVCQATGNATGRTGGWDGEPGSAKTSGRALLP
jgi:hypothetical protein